MVYQQFPDIEGFSEIPTYPGSTFIYENDLDNPTVKSFLSKGRSVYRTPVKTTDLEVFQFYSDNLPPTDSWELVNDVPRAAEDMLHGQYWINDDFGVRIYTVNNDIWYEKVTIDEANSGLADRVKSVTEREIILAPDDTYPTLPDFTWNLPIPSSYLADYDSTEFGDYRGITFRKIGSNSWDSSSVILVYWQANI